MKTCVPRIMAPRSMHAKFRRPGRRPTNVRSTPVDMLPLAIIFSALVIIGLIWMALRVTIKRDRATIAADMDEPHEIETYEEHWRKES